MGAFTEALIDGLMQGGIYALVAVGLTLIFGVMKVVNFAQGDFVMAGMYVALTTASLFGIVSWEFYIALLPAIIVSAVLGVAAYVLLLKSLVDKGHEPQIIATFGLSFLLQGAAFLLYGPQTQAVRGPLQYQSVDIFREYITTARLIAAGVAMALLACLYVFLKYTTFGKMARATADSPVMATLLGINVRRVYLVIFTTGIVLAGVAGALLLPYLSVFPTVGNLYVLTAYVVVVLGGMGDLIGAMIGGFVIGVIESMTATYVAFDLASLSTFLLFVALLLWRPFGLFGKARGV